MSEDYSQKYVTGAQFEERLDGLAKLIRDEVMARLDIAVELAKKQYAYRTLYHTTFKTSPEKTVDARKAEAELEAAKAKYELDEVKAKLDTNDFLIELFTNEYRGTQSLMRVRLAEMDMEGLHTPRERGAARG